MTDLIIWLLIYAIFTLIGCVLLTAIYFRRIRTYNKKTNVTTYDILIRLFILSYFIIIIIQGYKTFRWSILYYYKGILLW
jgi:hypothetical protein